MYDKLVTKVHKIDTSRFVVKTKYQTDKSELEKKVPNVSELSKKTNYNTKISSLTKITELIAVENKIPSVNILISKTYFKKKVTEIEGKVPDTTNLATKSALNAVDNKIPSTSNLVEKSKLTDIEKKLNDYDHDKYITTTKFNKLIVEKFSPRLKQENLVTKKDFDDKLKSLNQT